MLKKLLLVLLLVVMPAIASAEIVTPKIVVVNVQKIMKESKAAKDATKKLETKRDQYQSQITSEENKLKKSEEELMQQKNILSKEALAEKQKSFIKQINDVRSGVQKKKVKLDKAYKKALAEIQKAMLAVVEQMATEKGFNLAIPTTQLIYAEANMDITSEVLTRLDKKLPKATISFE